MPAPLAGGSMPDGDDQEIWRMAGARQARLCPLRARQNGESREFTVTHRDSGMFSDLGGSSSAALYPKPSKLVIPVLLAA